MTCARFLVACSILIAATARAAAPADAGPDDRLKADLLLVVAHPDDDTAVASYLARAIFDQKKRVAVLYTTRGESGNNKVAAEQRNGLGPLRELEARQALATFGVLNVWFLDGRDVASQNPLQSLEVWGHGAVLERAVRFVRLTRPEVIVTLLPSYVIGENHGDHQAAGVIASEAFDMAGDPSVFPAQLALEGARTWQPKKLYFFSDAARVDQVFAGKGPLYRSADVSPARRVPYYQLAAEEQSRYLTQDGIVARDSVKSGDFTAYLGYWKHFCGTTDVQLVFGKSLVRGAPTGDVFDGVAGGPIAFQPRKPYVPARAPLELAGPWGFYRDFWRAHGLEHLERTTPPVAGVRPGTTMQAPLMLTNTSSKPAEVTVSLAKVPEGWVEKAGSGKYVVPAHQSFLVPASISAPGAPSPTEQEVQWRVESGGRVLGSTALRVKAVSSTMPQTPQ